MIIIGLTGGIASGKSTVSAELKKLGLPIYDADAEARAAVAKGSEGLAQVIAAFGTEYLTAEGELDRAKVAERVFNDKEALSVLEGILHKIVHEREDLFLKKCKDEGATIVVLDVPLLIETGWYKKCDTVWLVSVSREQQIKRAMLRSGMTREEVIVRIDAQMSFAEKKKYANVVIDNSGKLEDTLTFVHKKIEELQGAKA